MRTIRRVAVLGAGTMGSRIAAHFANAGVPALLLDMVLLDKPDRNAAALQSIQTARKQKPGAFFTEAAAALVTPGNFEDHLSEVQNCDWIIEAVVENLDAKRALLEEVALWRRPGAIVSTNVRTTLGARAVSVYDVIAGLGGRPITKASLKKVFDEAMRDTLAPTTFLDLDAKLVERVLTNERQTRRSGPLPEHVLKERHGVPTH